MMMTIRIFYNLHGDGLDKKHGIKKHNSNYKDSENNKEKKYKKKHNKQKGKNNKNKHKRQFKICGNKKNSGKDKALGRVIGGINIKNGSKMLKMKKHFLEKFKTGYNMV